MGVSAPSVTAMAKRLAELGLVERAPYRGVVLTQAGRRAALEVLRHHRLLERYLAETLGLPLDEVHAEADRLEHALEELEGRIDEALGFRRTIRTATPSRRPSWSFRRSRTARSPASSPASARP